MANASRLLNGTPLDGIRHQDYEYARMLAALDFTIIKYPADWKSATECPDEGFLLQLWEWYLDCERKFSEALKKNL